MDTKFKKLNGRNKSTRHGAKYRISFDDPGEFSQAIKTMFETFGLGMPWSKSLRVGVGNRPNWIYEIDINTFHYGFHIHITTPEQIIYCKLAFDNR